MKPRGPRPYDETPTTIDVHRTQPCTLFNPFVTSHPLFIKETYSYYYISQLSNSIPPQMSRLHWSKLSNIAPSL